MFKWQAFIGKLLGRKLRYRCCSLTKNQVGICQVGKRIYLHMSKICKCNLGVSQSLVSSWDSQQGRLGTTSILVRAFWNFRHKVLKYSRNCNDHNTLIPQQSLFTTSIMDRQLLRQKVRQKISAIKTNTCDDITKIFHFGIIIHVLSWRQLKHKCLFWLMRFSDELFDVIINDP